MNTDEFMNCLQLARRIVDHHVADPGHQRRLDQHAEAWSIPLDDLLSDVALVIGLALCAATLDRMAGDGVTLPQVAEHLEPGNESALFAAFPLSCPTPPPS